jgi:hypothetical protein
MNGQGARKNFEEILTKEGVHGEKEELGKTHLWKKP